MTDNELKRFNIAFGLHSRIPTCCIRFFNDEWPSIWRNHRSPYVRAVNAARFGYVPCPDCLAKGNKVKLLVCRLECGGDHERDFIPKRNYVH